ncbi:MAG: hypothetical protein LC785_17310 [Acidobacteria bacterium]|nr:hypothetical protein [Acidobacteriota bacterium]
MPGFLRFQKHLQKWMSPVPDPFWGETSDRDEHRKLRDIIAALEKALAEAMCAAGYTVINTVKCRKPLDESQFEEVRVAFGREFPKLARRQGFLHERRLVRVTWGFRLI